MDFSTVSQALPHPARAGEGEAVSLHLSAGEMSFQLLEAFQDFILFFFNKNYDLKHLLC